MKFILDLETRKFPLPIPRFFGCVTFSHISFLFPGEKYETLIVDSGYKVYMKLRIRNVAKEDFMEYKCVSKNSLGGSDGSITLYGE